MPDCLDASLAYCPTSSSSKITRQTASYRRYSIRYPVTGNTTAREERREEDRTVKKSKTKNMCCECSPLKALGEDSLGNFEPSLPDEPLPASSIVDHVNFQKPVHNPNVRTNVRNEQGQVVTHFFWFNVVMSYLDFPQRPRSDVLETTACKQRAPTSLPAAERGPAKATEAS